MLYLHTKCYMPRSNGSLVIVNKSKAASMLFYILLKKILSCICFSRCLHTKLQDPRAAPNPGVYAIILHVLVIRNLKKCKGGGHKFHKNLLTDSRTFRQNTYMDTLVAYIGITENKESRLKM